MVNKNYKIIENHLEGYDEQELEKKYTDYFEPYDYILGDWSYGSLRLKGFCDQNNKIYKPINDIKKVSEYIKKHCAYGCKYFIIKKIKNEDS